MARAAERASAIICEASSIESDVSCAMVCMTRFIIICNRRSRRASCSASEVVGVVPDVLVLSFTSDVGSCNGCSLCGAAAVLTLKVIKDYLWIRRGRGCRDSSIRGKKERSGAAAVGTECGDVRGFKASEDVVARVTEGIMCADADEGILRLQRSQESGSARGAAAMMAYFEEGSGLETIVLEHAHFTGRFCVAFKENAGSKEGETHDKGIIVQGRAGIRVCAFRSEDGGTKPRPREGFAGMKVPDGDVLGCGLQEKSAE